MTVFSHAQCLCKPSFFCPASIAAFSTSFRCDAWREDASFVLKADSTGFYPRLSRKYSDASLLTKASSSASGFYCCFILTSNECSRRCAQLEDCYTVKPVHFCVVFYAQRLNVSGHVHELWKLRTWTDVVVVRLPCHALDVLSALEKRERCREVCFWKACL